MERDLDRIQCTIVTTGAPVSNNFSPAQAAVRILEGLEFLVSFSFSGMAITSDMPIHTHLPYHSIVSPCKGG